MTLKDISECQLFLFNFSRCFYITNLIQCVWAGRDVPELYFWMSVSSFWISSLRVTVLFMWDLLLCLPWLLSSLKKKQPIFSLFVCFFLSYPHICHCVSAVSSPPVCCCRFCLHFSGGLNVFLLLPWAPSSQVSFPGVFDFSVRAPVLCLVNYMLF